MSFESPNLFVVNKRVSMTSNPKFTLTQETERDPEFVSDVSSTTDSTSVSFRVDPLLDEGSNEFTNNRPGSMND